MKLVLYLGTKVSVFSTHFLYLLSHVCVQMLWFTCMGSELLIKDWQSFSIKGKIVNIFSFMGHVASVTMTRFCVCYTKAA